MSERSRVGYIPTRTACLALAGVCICTTLGYFIYEVFLRSLTAHALTLGGFIFTSAIYYCRTEANRKRAIRWSPELAGYTIAYAIANFVYWYAFWLGISAADSTTALGVLAVTALTTPLIVKLCRRTLTLNGASKLLIFSLIYIGAIALTKSKFNIEDIGSLTSLLTGEMRFAIICLSIAVLAEAATEAIKVSLVDSVNNKKIATRNLPRPNRFHGTEGDLAVDQMFMSSLIISGSVELRVG